MTTIPMCLVIMLVIGRRTDGSIPMIIGGLLLITLLVMTDVLNLFILIGMLLWCLFIAVNDPRAWGSLSSRRDEM